MKPPVIQTDTGTDTEVKSPPDPLSPPENPSHHHLPDILSNHRENPSDTNASAEEFHSCSGSPDAKGSAEAVKANSLLSKSATVGCLNVKRNFVLPPKEQRKSFGKEFVPAFKSETPAPLLIIKRTPSKINLPPEVGKPKVAVKEDIGGAKKYFGESNSAVKKRPLPKPVLKRSETNAALPPNKLVKQASLPETDVEKRQTARVTFNFEPKEEDLEAVDSYIEDLLANKEELMKPIDPNKYKAKLSESEDEEDEKVSSSIEDLLKALETETKAKGDELVEQPEEKIEDLLSWMENLDHQTQEHKVFRSYSDVKYKNLERILKVPKRADSVISKLPQDNIKYFERRFSGKPSLEEEERGQSESNFKLCRSKTDTFCNKGRMSSVDLDAVTNVDIKKVLMKFERKNSEEEEVKQVDRKRRSFSSGKVDCSKFDKSRSTSSEALSENSVIDAKENIGSNESDLELSNVLKDIEQFVDSTLVSLGCHTNSEDPDLENGTTLKSEVENDSNGSKIEGKEEKNGVSESYSIEKLEVETEIKENVAPPEENNNNTLNKILEELNSILPETKETPNKPDEQKTTEYSVTVKLTETTFPSPQQASQTDIDALYAKVNKQKPPIQNQSPVAPKRTKKPEPTETQQQQEQPQRPARQRSSEEKSMIPVRQKAAAEARRAFFAAEFEAAGENEAKPVAPQRKRSVSKSPLLAERKLDGFGGETGRKVVSGCHSDDGRKDGKDKDCSIQ